MSESSDGDSNRGEGHRRRRKRAIKIAIAAVAVEAVGLWRRGYGFGGNVVVRCRAGHMFTTIWLPAVSLKSLRLGLWRFQYCPVGKHWSLVTPASRAQLSPGQLEAAGEHRDIRIP
jgi:hypothetical protein